MVKVWINVMVGDPPLERVLDILDWCLKKPLQLTSPRSNIIGHQDVCKGCKVVIIISSGGVCLTFLKGQAMAFMLLLMVFVTDAALLEMVDNLVDLVSAGLAMVRTSDYIPY